MTSLVAGWISAVAVLFIVITRPWRSPAARAPLPLLLAVALAAWSLSDGAAVYQDLIAQGAWTAATIIIPYIPLKALVFALLAYAVGRTALSARSHDGPRRYLVPGSLAAVLLIALGLDLRASIDAARIRTARAETLTTAQIAGIVGRIAAKTALTGEIEAFLLNPLCPPDMLERYAGEAPFKVYVARNPKTPPDVLLQLSQDADPEVRYSTLYSGGLPASELPRLAADTDPRVRESAVWKRELSEEDFTLLLVDTEPRVRAAAALQPRISNDALLRLTEDADPNVRTNAVRIAIQRGLKE